MPSVKPFVPIRQAGVKTIVGANDQVAQNSYAVGVAFALPIGSLPPVSGEILSLVLFSTGGDILTPTGKLLLFNDAPAHATAAAALTADDHQKLVGAVDIASGDWLADTNGAMAFKEVAIPFHSLGNIYAVWHHQSSTSINSAAEDNEVLECNFWFRQDS